MATPPIVVTGDDVSFSATLTKGDITFNIPSGTPIKAALITEDHKTQLIADTVVTEVSGSDWPNSKIMIKFTKEQTALILAAQNAKLEVEVDDGGRVTWFKPINVLLGTVNQTP